MDVRALGSGGLVSSVIGLGTKALTGAYGPVSRREADRTIRYALDMGITMFDTADFYSGGETERLLGEALSGRRDAALVATCGGLRFNTAGKPVAVDGDPAYLARACDASLRRLRTDYIDLFYLARTDPQIPVQDSVGKLAELVAAGKIRYLGLCDITADQLRRAQEIHPISVLAVEYSLLQRSAEAGPLALASELGMGVVACSPLCRGLLTGGGSFVASPRQQRALRVIEAEAAELDVGIERLALAWLLAWRDDIVPVPSTRNPAHIEMSVSAPCIRLSFDTRARLAALFPTDGDYEPAGP